MTIKQLLEEIQRAFEKSGIENAKREAMLLACHILSCDQVYLLIHDDEYVDEKILLGAAALIKERCSGRPLCYVMGVANFYGLDVTVDERVLIPRPETELLVEEVLKSDLAEKDELTILDLCTGSGCISMALADNLKSSFITASDVSLKALQIARYNCRKYDNIKVVKSNLFEQIEEKFDIIISNPPYVAEKDRAELQREVIDFEPEIALFSGEDGMDLIREIIPKLSEHLNSNGLVLIEMSEDQVYEAEKLMQQTGEFKEISINKDLAGHNRYIKARKY